MGLLDDAIREHLDLKRRRGADPAEIERAEQEALGPVRRDPLGAEDPSLVDLAEINTAEPPPLAFETQVHSPALAQADDAHADVDGDEEFYDEYEVEAAAEMPVVEEPPGVAPPLAGEPSDVSPSPVPAEAPPAAPIEEGLGETVEYDVEHEEVANGDEDVLTESGAEDYLAEPGEEDVLEETPEFLQDTPDHDRLWFEQKPPRDFDFDG